MSLKNLAFIVYIFIGASIDTSSSVPVHSTSDDDVVQVTLLAEDSNPDFRMRRAADSNLPDHLSFGFPVQGENIELRFKRSRLLPTITSGSVDANRFSQDAAVYTDMTRGSAMIIKRDTEGYRLKGSFLHANQEWSMEPIERQRRDAGKERFFGLTHKIAMGTNNNTISLSGDAVIDTEEREELVKIWRRQGRGGNHEDGQERNNRSPLLPPREEGERSSSWGRGRQQEQSKRGNSRHKRAAIQHVIEIAFVVDNADYQKWVTLVGAGNAIAEMVLWYTFVAESIRIRFETIVDPDIAITITATVLRILNNPVDSDFIDSLATVNGTFDGGASLQAFRDWIPLQSDIIPLSDHYMLFTGHDMDYAGGKAFMSSVCKASGVSVVENSFSGFTGGLAAHELGHSLSALHDVDKAPTCDDSTQYVMATIFKIPADAGNEGNQWRFSPCSINSFKTYLSGVTCTLPENTSGLDELPAPGVDQRAEEVLDINTQCQLAMNYPDSVFCEGIQMNNGGLEAMCKIVFCKKAEGYCVGTIPQEYTSCGTGKWCEAGLCVDIPVETTTISTAEPTTVTATPFTYTEYIQCVPFIDKGDLPEFWKCINIVTVYRDLLLHGG